MKRGFELQEPTKLKAAFKAQNYEFPIISFNQCALKCLSLQMCKITLLDLSNEVVYEPKIIWYQKCKK